MTTEDTKEFSPSNVANSETIKGVNLSPDTTQVIYHVKPLYKSGEHDTCAIWIADTDKADSARQLTSGLHNDNAARFHPDGKRVVFLSDRHKPGGPQQVYSINLSGGEASPLFGKDNKRKVSLFEISPDGKYIAFLSADEPTPEDEQREKDRNDPIIFGDRRKHEYLRIFTFSTGAVQKPDTLGDGHTTSLTWTSDSRSVLFLLQKHAELEFSQQPIEIKRFSVLDSQAQTVGSYPRNPKGVLNSSSGQLIDIQSYEPSCISDSKSVFIHNIDSFAETTRLFGDIDDAVRLVDLQKDGLVAVEIASGMDTGIVVLNPVERGLLGYLFHTGQEGKGYLVLSWDARRRPDGSFIFAGAHSSAFHREPPNIWVRIVDALSLQKDSTSVGLCNFDFKLSNHLQWMRRVPKIESRQYHWKVEEAGKAVTLQGLLLLPEKKAGPYPTILLIHGGPYSRVTGQYVPSYYTWEFLLAHRGYLVIQPNYRGGQGFGSNFARAAQGGMGTVDWSDCMSMLSSVISEGLADPKRLGIGGWSQGGFLTAWGVSQTKNVFKAGVMGAGVSDWGAMAAESDMPEFEADLGGGAPWDTSEPSERADLRGSPIGHITDVETAMLILHGEKDLRVPANQGIEFFRGLRRKSKYPGRAQLILYPREPHDFKERKHAEDVMKRVIEHFDRWL